MITRRVKEMGKETHRLIKNYRSIKDKNKTSVTDEEFQMLRLLIEKSIQQTNELQKTYRDLTGKDYNPYGRL